MEEPSQKDHWPAVYYLYCAIFLVFGVKIGYIIIYCLSALRLVRLKCLDLDHYVMEFILC
jgi:hypothetical protein